jgi:D-alanyl-D-alanine carboxypeptidase
MDGNRRFTPRKTRRSKKGLIKSIIILVQWFVILALIIALIVTSIKYNNLLDKNTTSDPNVTSSQIETTSTVVDSTSSVTSLVSSNSDVTSTTSSASSVTSNNTTSNNSSQTQSQPTEEYNKWYLKLANPDNSVSKEFINNVNKAKINSKFTSGADSSKYLDSRIVDKFNAMCQAALNDGVSLISVSAYRTYSYQNTLYNNRVNRCMNENSNLSREEAKKIAATIVAFPGTSEHHLGLAVDINSVEETFENTKAFRWLQENAADYGFIMRYPKDKQNITKIIYEPWHYRYVGVEHAKEMLRLDMCMEEYLDHLKTK